MASGMGTALRAWRQNRIHKRGRCDGFWAPPDRPNPKAKSYSTRPDASSPYPTLSSRRTQGRPTVLNDCRTKQRFRPLDQIPSKPNGRFVVAGPSGSSFIPTNTHNPRGIPAITGLAGNRRAGLASQVPSVQCVYVFALERPLSSQCRGRGFESPPLHFHNSLPDPDLGHLSRQPTVRQYYPITTTFRERHRNVETTTEVRTSQRYGTGSRPHRRQKPRPGSVRFAGVTQAIPPARGRLARSM